MRVSKRFPIAVHALMLIEMMDRLDGAEKATSDMIAESTGINPVMVRNIFSGLKRSGLIHASAGKSGGVTLALPKANISLWNIYCAVETEDVNEIFKIHENPSKICPVGRNIYQLLIPHMDDAINAMKKELSLVTLDTLINELHQVL